MAPFSFHGMVAFRLVEPNGKRDEEDTRNGRMFRKPTTSMPIFPPTRKDPLVSSFGLPAHSLGRQPQIPVTGTQREKKFAE